MLREIDDARKIEEVERSVMGSGLQISFTTF
jgi:hypothetical protein